MTEDNSSTSYDWTDTNSFYVATVIRITFTVIYIPIGTVGNVLSFIVMQDKCLKSSTTVFLSALAVYDTLVLYLDCLVPLFSQTTGFYIPNQSNFLCKMHTFLKHLLVEGSSWLLVLVAMERAMSVTLPLKWKSICTIRNANLSVCGMIFFLACITARVIFLRGLNENGQCSPYERNKWFTLYISIWIIRGLYYIIPTFFILICNAVILIKIREPVGASSQRRNQAIAANTKIMLVSTAAFLVTTTPQFIFYIIIPTYAHMSMEEKAYYAVGNTLVEGLYYLNNVLNFWIYVQASPKFRKHLKRILKIRAQIEPGSATNLHQGVTSASNGMTTYHLDESVSSVLKVCSSPVLATVNLSHENSQDSEEHSRTVRLVPREACGFPLTEINCNSEPHSVSGS